MKNVKLLHAEPELRPDGTKAYTCVLMSPVPGEDLLVNDVFLDPRSVYGLNAGDIVADGSILLTPEKKYIAWANNSFAEVGAAYDVDAYGPPSWMSYVVIYYVGDDLYQEQLVPVAECDMAVALGAPMNLPEGAVFNGWSDGSDTYQPGDILPELDYQGLTLEADITEAEDTPVLQPIGFGGADDNPGGPGSGADQG